MFLQQRCPYQAPNGKSVCSGWRRSSNLSPCTNDREEVEIQDMIVIHLILQSLAVIAAIYVLMILAGWGLQAALERVFRDRRQKQTEDGSQSGYTASRLVAGPGCHFRRAASDADDPRVGDRRIVVGLPGLHLDVLWLVLADGTQRNPAKTLAEATFYESCFSVVDLCMASRVGSYQSRSKSSPRDVERLSSHRIALCAPSVVADASIKTDVRVHS